MYISLTNALPDFKGLPITFKKDSIMSIRQGFAKRDGQEQPDIVTYIYCPPHGTWEVIEPYDKVLAMLNGETESKPKKKAV